MIEIRLRTRQGNFLLDVNIRSEARILGLFGPSGSGKTSILNCIAGLLQPENGIIRIGRDVLFDSTSKSNLAPQYRSTGYVFQDGLLFEHMSVRSNILYGHTDNSTGPKLVEVVDTLELGTLMERSPLTLSGGEKRRVAIARALMRGPRILLLDEPLTGLDTPLAGRILGYLHKILAQFRLPAIYVSHAIGDILFLCDEAVVLKDGAVVAQGAPRAVLLGRQAARGYSGEELAALNNTFAVQQSEIDPESKIMRGNIGGCALLGYPARAVGENLTPLTCSVRASDVILSKNRPTGISARNILRGVIREISDVLDRNIVTISSGPTWLVEVSRSSVSELQLEVGQEVFMIVKATAVSFH